MVVSQELHKMEATCASMILSVRTWLQKAGLERAEHKTEEVLISSRKKVESINSRACYLIKHVYKVFRISVGSPAKHHVEKTNAKAARITAYQCLI